MDDDKCFHYEVEFDICINLCYTYSYFYFSWKYFFFYFNIWKNNKYKYEISNLFMLNLMRTTWISCTGKVKILIGFHTLFSVDFDDLTIWNNIKVQQSPRALFMEWVHIWIVRHPMKDMKKCIRLTCWSQLKIVCPQSLNGNDFI